MYLRPLYIIIVTSERLINYYSFHRKHNLYIINYTILDIYVIQEIFKITIEITTSKLGVQY